MIATVYLHHAEPWITADAETFSSVPDALARAREWSNLAHYESVTVRAGNFRIVFRNGETAKDYSND